LTLGYRLPAKFVIHTVGPVWRGGSAREPELLASCYRSALLLASDHALGTIAFPGISTGVYGYPVELAAQVAVGTVVTAMAEADTLREVLFCCFSAADLAVYEQQLRASQ
jgi:O-acetyl-ADP-ribose deacetylase (regulator of RNase III)